MIAAKSTRKLLFYGLLLLTVAAAGAISYKFLDDNLWSRPVASCPALVSPAEVDRVVSVLYPGQIRGGDYKAHGGFRIEGTNNDNVNVRAPLSGRLKDAGRYIEIGEVQYIFDFKADCGLEYRLDHLRTLTPKLQAVVDRLPPAKAGNSNTDDIKGSVRVEAGEVMATGVGFLHSDHGANVSFDFGLYDFSKKNEITRQNPHWADGHHQESNDQAEHGLCWLDRLPIADATKLKTLPGGDQASGKTSDYCH